jgi:hypothetical protein
MNGVGLLPHSFSFDIPKYFTYGEKEKSGGTPNTRDCGG